MMRPILIAVPQSNELLPLLSGLDRLGHPSQPILIGNMPCYSLPSLGATAAICGHGKTQFAVQCQYLIDRCDGLAALFCVGAAGSLSPDVHFGDVVVGESTIEHDYKIRFEPAESPCHAANEILLNEFRQAAVGTQAFRTHFAPIASGDEDIVDEVRARELQQFSGAQCVAWEGSGGARAAAFNGLPFLEIRCITDDADAHAAVSFRANCQRVLPNIADLLVRWRSSQVGEVVVATEPLKNLELTIRTATMDDYSAVCRLLHELDDHHVRIRPDVFQPFDDPGRQRERIARFVNENDAEMFVAEISTDLVGLATVRISDNANAPMFRPGRRACMDDLVVNRNFQGLGIARRLLDRVTQWTQSRQLQCININVWNVNKSGLSFFTTNGFTPRCQQMDLRIDKAT